MIMPLKFLKKCRQYNVTSKNLFVISVHHLLDTSTTVDCTISSESKGQECLDNVCQRLLIQQPEFFGLRYLVKGKEDEHKWIDLERSLSRQLEKYAANAKIYLRVRHYVTTGVRHLNDEVTRYYYFLQLKSDIYEGKIACDIRTAILLALYCRQAEYDSYQSEKQTKDYLKKSLVLPRNLQGLANDDNMLDTLILEVLQQNAGIANLTQNPAEEMYIQCCQTLDGYGEERFQAKDTLGNDLLLGLAINGMVVTADNGRQYFPWKDFHTVTIDKRTIKIEQNKVDGDGSIVGSFIFNEADMARYFWKLCITSHKFFKRYIDTDAPSVGSGVDMENANGEGNYAYEYGDASMQAEQQQQLQQRVMYASGEPGVTMSGSGLIAAGQREEYLSAQSLPQQMPHGLMASTNSSASALMSSNISLAASHQSGGGNGGGTGMHSTHAASGQSWLNKDYGHDYVSTQLLSHSMLDTRLGQSTSCLDLSNNNLHSSTSMLAQNHNNNHALTADAHERERLKAMLPTYRPAPDYETAVQLKKYRTPSADLHNLNTIHGYHTAATLGAAHASATAYYAGSQPDVHNPNVYGDGVLLGHLTAHRYPDVAQPAVAMHAHHHMNAAAALHQQQQQHAQHAASGAYVDLPQRMHIMRQKAPPPYPVNRLSSSSTPDLAVASHRPLLGYRNYVSGSSPDLVSNRNMLNNSQYPYGASAGVMNTGAGNTLHTTSSGATMLHQYPYIGHIGHSQPFLPPHGTFENLNMIEEQPSIMSQLRQSALSQAAATQVVSQSYEQHSPTLPPSGYRGSASSQQMAAAVTQQQQQSQTSQATTQQQTQPTPLQRSAMNGSIEPIYENVPLPQYANNNNLNPASQRNSEQRSSGASSHNTNTATHNGNNTEPMRHRASSVQSAPGMMPVPATRHHHQTLNTHQHPQQQHHDEQQRQQQEQPKLHVDRAASTDLAQLLEPTPPQRAMRSASAAPAIGIQAPTTPPITQTPPPRQHRGNLMKHAAASASVSAVDVISPANVTTLASTRHASASHDDSLHQQFGAMNLSSSTSTASIYNTTLDTTTTTLNSTNTTTSSKDVKRKKRWNILGRSKTPDKQKSATLGREKASTSEKSKIATKLKLAQDDLNVPHRWSTGVPKLQPISAQYSKDKLCQILDSKLNDAQLFIEFERIPKRRDQACYDSALLEENAAKNYDPNFLPYEDNRVRITPTMDNRHGYVNASPISATVGTNQRFYILAQSPHDELTSRIFWQCVWEADVYLVVQLSVEMDYIPPTANERMEFGQFQVYQEFSQTSDRCTTSKLRLYHGPSRRYRSVWHLQYADWAAQNCPRDVSHFLDFLEELNSVRLASTQEVPPGHNRNPPVLIHCLEGGGRSGVTLTADLLLYTLDHNQDLDIPRVIGQLRHQRDSIIPSLAQYKFIYSLLITYLKRTRLI